MRFMLIEPQRERMGIVEHAEFDDALRAAGLSRGKVDHGMLTPRLGIVVFEFAMFAHPDQLHATIINNKLYAGNAIVYAVDEFGQTVDVDERVKAEQFSYTFLHGRFDVEAAILTGMITRPILRVNGETIWRWPEPVPSDFPKR